MKTDRSLSTTVAPFASPARPVAVAVAVAIAVASAGLAGCRDEGKANAAKARASLAFLTPLVERDVAEIERGLPEGARRLEPLYAGGADPRNDMKAVRTSLKAIRRDIVDLTASKSTFFALADRDGIGIRNDLEQDLMAGQNLLAIFPALAAARGGAFVTTTGLFPGPVGPAGPNRDWIAATPVKADGGVVGGLLVTGWTYRSFARHLQESLLKSMKETAAAASDTGKLPIVYVAIFDGAGVFSAPLTPVVNEQALAGLGLVAKTAPGQPVDGAITITERVFGYAAARAPKLGPDVGVVVLESDI